MKSQIETLYENTSKLVSELYDIGAKKGILLDYDFQKELFYLFLDGSIEKMKLMKKNIEAKIKNMEGSVEHIAA